MNKLPRNVKAQKLIKFLLELDFVQGKAKGSHIRFTHPDGRWTQVAAHPKPIPIGTLHKIIKQAKISEEELIKLK